MTLRLTEKRTKILSTLQKSAGSLSAGQIHKLLPDIDLVTIYRNLDLFVKEKIIQQVHLGTDEAQYEFQSEAHHHAICVDCEKIIHFKAPTEQIKKLLGLRGFHIDELEVTVRGTCHPKKKR